MSFSVLGLTPEADERTVRRAYARLLKSHRPDDDPAAFQRLHEAYTDCLEILRQLVPASRMAREATERPVEAITFEPTTTELDPTEGPEQDAGHAFDFESFARTLITGAHVSTRRELLDWLQAQPELLSVRRKAAMLPAMVERLGVEKPPLPSGSIEVILEFFGVTDLGPRGWRLVEELQVARARADLEVRIAQERLPRTDAWKDAPAFERLIDRELSRPRGYWRTLLIAFWPGGPSQAALRIRELDFMTEGQASFFLDTRRRDLLTRLADRRRLGWDRVLLSLARTAVFGGALVGLFSLLLGFDSGLAGVVLGVGVCFLAWQAASAGYWRLRDHFRTRGRDWILRDGVTATAWLTALLLGGAQQAWWQLNWLPYALVGLAIASAYGASRWLHGIGSSLMLAAANLLIFPVDGGLLPPGFPGATLPAVFALGLDHIRARRTGRPVDAVRHDIGYLRVFTAVSFLALIAAGFHAIKQ